MNDMQNAFSDLLEILADHGSIKSPDFVAITLPLLEAVCALHQENQVAHISSIDQIAYENKILVLNSEPRDSITKTGGIFRKPVQKGVFEVSENIQQTSDLASQSIDSKNLDILGDEKPITKPVYISGYKCWDNECGQYDPITDIFQLGQVLASVAFNLDFRNPEDLQLFVSNRKRLYFLNRELHPTIHAVIFEMTNLYTEDRTKNLDEIIAKLKNYREYNPENYVDLTQTEGFRSQDISDRNNWILSKLKNRLFDISRRNKLLYFTDRQSFLNLTISSVPLLLDHENVQEDSLIFWNSGIHKKIIKQQKLNLNNYLDYKENRFTAPSLNKIRLEARKSKNEYGFSQLRMVIAFLHWYNFKEDSDERITSPLLLLPADVIKKKGVKDQYVLEFSTTEAEINPILSHFLRDLYDIQLPDFVDLETTSIEELIKSIEAQIADGGTGIKLEWRDKPKIQLIHSIAKKNFSLRNKKLANQSRGLNLKSFSYSYDKGDFQPLGLQIFNERIRHRNSALEYIINEDLKPENNAVAEKVRTFYQSDNDGEHNPLVWEVDTCNITLGNFNYRKMSLVRDYNEIINSNIKDDVFEQLFSDSPKKTNVENEKTGLQDSFPIIASDPTQASAIEIARSGESYIIQGPPGTGKSQTITNLIADYISRDKKILFVCEKRAALDVVFHRLKNKNLDELCCLVHDSQMDKKSFIQDLKVVYEDFQKNALDPEAIESSRSAIVSQISDEIDSISHFHKSMSEGEIVPLELFTVIHGCKAGKTPPTAIECIHLPKYDEWKQNSSWIIEWLDELKRQGFESYISQYPLARLSGEVLDSANPKSTILENIEACTKLVSDFSQFVSGYNEIYNDEKSFEEWAAEHSLASKVRGLSDVNKLSVFDSSSDVAKDLNLIQKDIAKKEKSFLKQEKKNINWKKPFDATDSEAAAAQWGAYQGSILRFLKLGFYRLKKKIQEAYNFSAHDIRPQIGQVLSNLVEQHHILRDIETLKEEICADYNLTDYDKQCAFIDNIQKSPNPTITRWIESDYGEFIKRLTENQDAFGSLSLRANMLFSQIDKISLNELSQKLASSKSALSTLSVFLPFIRNANSTSDTLKTCLFTKQWDASEYAYFCAYKSLQDIYEANLVFSETDGDTLQVSIGRINDLLDKYYDSNVEAIRIKIRQKFLNMVRITESVAAQLSPDEKLLKKTYRSGRRILENEFGKSMRYKSIRELTENDAKDLMTTIKPVWLMSPLSVSDVLPIDTSIFDVVIYDEASQITVEEGVPSLFRTHQTIVVGDEMQMPPTNFFGSSSVQDEEEEDVENKIGISLDAESLLNQSSRKLASVMLGWHYRSRHESLISFSNAAFYKRGLLTIPDTVASGNATQPIDTVLDVSVDINPDDILKRSISFHYLENAVYENRKNKDEADYIANIIRQLLRGDSQKSIGVVAFSMDQQSEIESALDRLASVDSEFESLLEEEYQRIDEDQFNGLFVKNLENVQGDERDIIIMSVCYGSNSKGKMLMNFGPINRRGGEKRLNVIFSRAKEHMVIVSSILAAEIKNDYNEGANYFKRFLAYAKSCSDGRDKDVDLVLDGMHSYDEEQEETSINPVVQQLKEALTDKGYMVEYAVGRSHFKCDLAVKKPDSGLYSLGILVDKKDHYSNTNILEQYCQKPEILRAFGWRISNVYTKDWLEQPHRVLNKIDLELSAQSN